MCHWLYLLRVDTPQPILEYVNPYTTRVVLSWCMYTFPIHRSIHAITQNNKTTKIKTT